MKIFPGAVIESLTLIAGCLFFEAAFAQGSNGFASREPHFHSKLHWAVGFGMEGTATNVALADERIQFQVKGRFWFTQYPPESTRQVMIEVHPEKVFPARVSPGSFVAMTSDWRAGSVATDKGRLLKILTAAGERGSVVKFSLMNPKMDFGTNGFAILDAKVWRLTDPDLR